MLRIEQSILITIYFRLIKVVLIQTTGAQIITADFPIIVLDENLNNKKGAVFTVAAGIWVSEFYTESERKINFTFWFVSMSCACVTIIWSISISFYLVIAIVYVADCFQRLKRANQ